VPQSMRHQGRAAGRAADQLRHHGRLTIYLNTNLCRHVRPTPSAIKLQPGPNLPTRSRRPWIKKKCEYCLFV
jgi:hypothetical protein